MDQRLTPLFTALIQHQAASPVSLHVPGHKNGGLIPSNAKDLFSTIMKIDLTELTGLDDLHSPSGVIKEAQDLIANFYNVSKSYFLVGGSTAGNLAMILAVCKQGDIVLVQRNCHKSIIHGLQLAGVTPVFLSPLIEKEGGIPVGITLQTIKKAFNKYIDVKAVILTYPNYYGMAINDTKEIIELAHQFNIPVLVDEAHGAHFAVNKLFPISSIELGADIIVHSAHKTLPAMTMGSYLHFNSSIIDKDKVEFYLQVIQSSSPSYPIMASLDLARYYLATMTEEHVYKINQTANKFVETLNRIPQIKVLTHNEHEFKTDILKVIVQLKCRLTGFELQSLLEKKGIYTELADPYHVLLILPLDSSFEFKKIINAFIDVFETIEEQKENKVPFIDNFDKDLMMLSLPYQDMDDKQTMFLPLKDASGFVSATNVIPYPPGIPAIMIGELITSDHILYVQALRQQGASFQKENELWTKGIKVFVL